MPLNKPAEYKTFELKTLEKNSILIMWFYKKLFKHLRDDNVNPREVLKIKPTFNQT